MSDPGSETGEGDRTKGRISGSGRASSLGNGSTSSAQTVPFRLRLRAVRLANQSVGELPLERKLALKVGLVLPKLPELRVEALRLVVNEALSSIGLVGAAVKVTIPRDSSDTLQASEQKRADSPAVGFPQVRHLSVGSKGR